MRRVHPLSVFWCALGLGCGGAELKTQAGASDSEAPPPETDELPGVDDPGVGTVPELESSAPSTRQRKRMTVGQVRDSMEAITGGVRWGDGEASDWDSYAATLGVADYQTRTVTDLGPSVLFQKFLDDAGKQSCRSFVSDEFARGDSERLWLVGLDTRDDHASSPALVEEALSRGFLRFHGVRVTDDVLQPWLEAFNQAVGETGDASGAWTMICVGYVTHPDFYGH